ncbi:MAG: metallophosphoesterase [Colwellia sp.]|nr:metallophosphoesterase [Colwellia sp.]
MPLTTHPALPAEFTIAQISDCHLFSKKDGLHYGANVYQNLVSVLQTIKTQFQVQVIVFTGDITQDHSEVSYQRFVQAVSECKITTPFYYLAGNHDEHELLDKHLSVAPFNKNKIISDDYWQITLLNSKSETPKGFVAASELLALENNIDNSKYQLIMMHHHPLDVGYFIDRHGLENQRQFWQTIDKQHTVKAIACGHVHQAMTIYSKSGTKGIPLYTCPATSIQFDKNKDSGSSNGQGGGFRIFSLYANGQIATNSHFLAENINE